MMKKLLVMMSIYLSMVQFCFASWDIFQKAGSTDKDGAVFITAPAAPMITNVDNITSVFEFGDTKFGGIFYSKKYEEGRISACITSHIMDNENDSLVAINYSEKLNESTFLGYSGKIATIAPKGISSETAFAGDIGLGKIISPELVISASLLNVGTTTNNEKLPTALHCGGVFLTKSGKYDIVPSANIIHYFYDDHLYMDGTLEVRNKPYSIGITYAFTEIDAIPSFCGGIDIKKIHATYTYIPSKDNIAHRITVAYKF